MNNHDIIKYLNNLVDKSYNSNYIMISNEEIIALKNAVDTLIRLEDDLR